MIKTYIEGFDDALGGGVPAGHTVLISGTPGTMKSSVCLNLLYKNHKNDAKRSLYISLEETKDSLLTGMNRLKIDDFDGRELFIVDLGKLRMEYDEVDQMQDWMRFVTEYLTRRVKEDNVDIVIIDSLTALYSLIELDKPRQQLFHFFGFLKRLGVTAFLISEMYPGSEAFGPYREDFLADGNIMLKLHDVGETDIQLRIRCVKMRHVNHDRGYFVLIHRGNRFMVTPVISD
ncbi:MAG: AAA family ATPase [Thermoplasmata archaeon]|nr:AAA family ATPase [Thermoplasmata archaeon]